MEIIAVIFVLVMLGVAYITFRMLKKMVKFAARALIVLLILVVTFVGGIMLWNYGDSSSTTKKPRTTKTKKSR